MKIYIKIDNDRRIAVTGEWPHFTPPSVIIDAAKARYPKMNEWEAVYCIHFTMIDYGKNNNIKRDCHACKKPHLQCEMKEVGRSEYYFQAYHDSDKHWRHSVFFCEGCWEHGYELDTDVVYTPPPKLKAGTPLESLLRGNYGR